MSAWLSMPWLQLATAAAAGAVLALALHNLAAKPSVQEDIKRLQSRVHALAAEIAKQAAFRARSEQALHALRAAVEECVAAPGSKMASLPADVRMRKLAVAAEQILTAKSHSEQRPAVAEGPSGPDRSGRHATGANRNTPPAVQQASPLPDALAAPDKHTAQVANDECKLKLKLRPIGVMQTCFTTR
jgi:hypothetical protein